MYPALLDQIESMNKKLWITIDPFDRKTIVKRYKTLLVKKILYGGTLTKFERNINERTSPNIKEIPKEIPDRFRERKEYFNEYINRSNRNGSKQVKPRNKKRKNGNRAIDL